MGADHKGLVGAIGKLGIQHVVVRLRGGPQVPTHPGNGTSEIAQEADVSRHDKIGANDPKQTSRTAFNLHSIPIACPGV
jgi:hypothetical protein